MAQESAWLLVVDVGFAVQDEMPQWRCCGKRERSGASAQVAQVLGQAGAWASMGWVMTHAASSAADTEGRKRCRLDSHGQGLFVICCNTECPAC